MSASFEDSILMRSVVVLLLAATALSGCATQMRDPSFPVLAARETAAVGSMDDAADDPAIWVDRANPEQSRIIGTDKQGGLYVYDLAGRELQFVPAGLVNNVDLRNGFAFGDGAAPIVVASDRDDQTIAIFRFDPATRQLRPAQIAAISSGFPEVYGVCLYRAPNGTTQLIATSALGAVKQWRLEGMGTSVTATQVRRFDLGSIAEGCVADDATGALYIAEENVGIWRLGADPTFGDNRVLIDRTGTGHLTADVEGLAIYAGANGTGYVVASSQGSSQFVLYERREDNAYVGTFSIGANGNVDGVSGTDGIEVSSANLGPDWPGGIMIAQDDENMNPTQPQNFKMVPWRAVEEAIAKMRLK